jgi:hypothetical protein
VRKIDRYAPLPIPVVADACWLTWWLLRGSAYGVWLCLRPQLSVPAEGWRIVGRGVRNLDLDSELLFVLLTPLIILIIPIIVLGIVLGMLMLILF